MRQWQFYIDVGGTFTDCIALAPDGSTHTHKLLSSSAYKGHIHRVENGSFVIDTPFPCPDNFFKNFSFMILQHDGHQPLAQGRVLRSDKNGTIVLDKHPDFSTLNEKNNLLYELRSREPAPVCGIRSIMGLTPDADIGSVSIKLGTTKGTNALLERKGARTALITTIGFRDILAIGTQNRPKLFALNIKKHEPLYETVVEVSERLDARGRILIPMDEENVRKKLTLIKNKGIESLAICLLHAHKNNAHELKIESIAKDMGFLFVSTSSRIVNLQKIVARGETTVADAYLTPVIKSYVESILSGAPKAQIKMMTSSGGLVSARHFVGKDSILSGPAGGVVGVAHVAKKTGRKKVIGFDMGGTSTDICRYDQQPEMRYEMEFNNPLTDSGTRIVAPMLAIETVAAGGGSLCSFDGIKLTVGPGSAGADPGPACYGNGGPLTITDCNLFLGRIMPDSFSFPLHPVAAKRRLTDLQQEMRKGGFDLSMTEIAEGFLKIAASNMAQPILKLSMHKGYDVREYSLVSFGGAGAQHACQVAEELGVTSIIQHPLASVLSAWGIGYADAKKQVARDFGKSLSMIRSSDLESVFLQQENQLRIEFAKESDLAEKDVTFVHSMDLRYKGQDSLINVYYEKPKSPREAFEEQHFQTFGFNFQDRDIEIRNLRSEGTVKLTSDVTAVKEVAKKYSPEPLRSVQASFNQTDVVTKVFSRGMLKAGATIDGPALIVDDMTTSVLIPGWSAEMLPEDILEFKSDLPKEKSTVSSAYDPVNLALFSNMFTSIAEQMGAVLQRTALSVNVKERLDFSCAVFTAEGGLIVNAPHIPVHLGSMGDCVRAIIAHVSSESNNGSMAPGDVFVSNDPYAGGSHLPDVTVITPVWSKTGKLLFFTGNRAHHAEIGGITPGSMPPTSKNLAEEGVLIKNFHLVRRGQSREAELRRLLEDAPYPSRNVADNLADINAQVAANEIGRQRLLDLTNAYGETVVFSYMRQIRLGASLLISDILKSFRGKVLKFADCLDDGTTIQLEIRASELAEKIVTLDFTGSGPTSPGNGNANSSIVKAAVLYSLRCLVNRDIPLNEGVLDPVELLIPTPSILNPVADTSTESFVDAQNLPAVTAGNVETSQRIVDVVLGALGVAAASQGTMNNMSFGKPASKSAPGFGYYETICGGSGAGPGFNGCDAVHTHMTNTRITDPEVLEERFPVRLRRFEIRSDSGGQGKWHGGQGVIREIECLDHLDLSVISNRRTTSPYGLAGGQPGAPGKNLIKRNGSSFFEEQASSFQTTTAPGDVIQIKTPGGGGYGKS